MYTPLATVTLTSAVNSVTFGSIPNTYRDLIIIFNGSGQSTNITLQINGDETASAYIRQRMSGNGTTASAQTITSNAFFLSSASDIVASSQCKIEILDANTTDKHKNILARTGTPGSGTDAVTGRWTNVARVQSVVLRNALTTNTFTIGSTFSLYGVVA